MVAISEHMLKMDKQVRAAVEAICTEDNVREIVARHVRDALDYAIKQEATNYFGWGPGREHIKRAVGTMLDERSQP
jgi:hypothetical protein